MLPENFHKFDRLASALRRQRQIFKHNLLSRRRRRGPFSSLDVGGESGLRCRRLIFQRCHQLIGGVEKVEALGHPVRPCLQDRGDCRRSGLRRDGGCRTQHRGRRSVASASGGGGRILEPTGRHGASRHRWRNVQSVVGHVGAVSQVGVVVRQLRLGGSLALPAQKTRLSVVLSQKTV